MRLDPRRLLTFRAVAEARSFSLAAKALALTQPAVSQQIRALEEQVGGRLIERPGGEPTALGALLLTHANALADVLRLAETQVEEAVDGQRRRVRIGAFPSALASLVPACIAELGARVDGFEASVVQGATDELVAAVRGGSVHVAICFEDARRPPTVHAGVRRHDLFVEPMAAALGPEHRLAARKRIRLADLAGETWIAATEDGLIQHACVAAGFEPEVAYRTSDPLATRALVAGGLAVTLAPRLLHAELPGVALVALADPPTRTVYAVVPPGAPHPLAADFVSALRRRGGSLTS